jgi:molecular chaperone GrpE
MPEETTTTESPESLPSEDAALLQDRIARLERQNAELVRHLADFQNRNNEMLQVMKRKDADLDQRLKYSHDKLALDLLTALDNLERAVDAAKKAGEKGPLAVGVMATHAQVLDVLKRYGVTPIEALGQPFDPLKHQAIQTLPGGKGQEPNTVAAVAQQGFMIHDRVLRPAGVIVAQ